MGFFEIRRPFVQLAGITSQISNICHMEKTLWWTVRVPVQVIYAKELSPAARCLYMVLLTQRTTTTFSVRRHDLQAAGGFKCHKAMYRYRDELLRHDLLVMEPPHGRAPATFQLAAQKGAEIAVPASLVLHPGLRPAARTVYGMLLSHVKAGKPRLTTHLQDLRAAVGYGSDNTVRSWMQQLLSHGWIRFNRTKDGAGLEIELLDPHLALRQAEATRAASRMKHAPHLGEAILKEMLNVLVPDDRFQDNARLGEVVNPLKGHYLAFDRSYRQDAVAIEFDGPHHDHPTAAVSAEEVHWQRARDHIKNSIAQQIGIRLVRFTDQDLTFEQVAAKLDGLLPLRKIRAEDPVVQLLTKATGHYRRKIRRLRARAAVAAIRATEPTHGSPHS